VPDLHQLCLRVAGAVVGIASDFAGRASYPVSPPAERTRQCTAARKLLVEYSRWRISGVYCAQRNPGYRAAASTMCQPIFANVRYRDPERHALVSRRAPRCAETR